jgi:ankyrin repeat protein
MKSDRLSEREKHSEFLSAVYSDMKLAASMARADPDCIRYRCFAGETVFHYLIVENDIERAAELLACGSDINSQTDFGASPLIHATMLNYLPAVQWLVSKGASLEPKTVNGETALTYAATNENAAIYKFLIGVRRKHPIDFYFDNLTADAVYRDKDLVMRDHLIGLGLSRRYDCDDEDEP